MINGTEYVNANVLADLLQERGLKVVTTFSAADVKATLGLLLAKIQKFCHSNSRSPNPVKILLLGSDAFITSVLKPYILELSSKPPDWQGYLRFLIVSLSSSSSHSIAKHLSLIDASYRSLFDDVTWRENLDKIDSLQKDAQDEIVGRLLQYIGGAEVMLQLPVAEAMLTLREKSSEEDSTQVNVPFISDVRIGNLEIDADDASSFLNNSMNSSVSSSIDTPGPLLPGSGGGGGGGGSPPSSSMMSNFIGKESEKEKEKRADEKKEKEEDRRKSGLNFVYEGLYPEPSSGGGGSSSTAACGAAGVNSVVAGSSGVASTVGTPPNSPLLVHQGSFPAFPEKTSTPGSDKYVITTPSAITSTTEVQEVQVDYWTPTSKQESSQSLGLTTEKEDKEKDSKKKEKTEKFKIETDGTGGAVGKNSLKGHVRFLQVSRLSGSSYAGLLSMLVLTKEKKAKMIRIGKKSKENAEGKSQLMEGITRLICSATKNHNLRVGIDGVEWNGVKFFQLSAQWNSQIKQFPVLIFANPHHPQQQQQQQFAHGTVAIQGNQTRP